jgi:60 kDa SS-A/Ro ribonucleoprotein
LFKSAPAGRTPPVADIFNSEGAPAYSVSEKETLAQYVATGMLGSTFYASDEEQLDKILELAAKLDPEYLAKVALYGRRSAFMKDAPALLLAHLMTRNVEGMAALKKAFPLILDNPKMLRTFVQIVKSGKVGRKSFGTAPKKLIEKWFADRSDAQLIRATGDKPSIADVIKMVHPKPATDVRKETYAWLIGKKVDLEKADPLLQAYEAWKKDPSRPVPDVPFLMLTNTKLSKEQWKDIARSASWQTARMNLNTFQRHGVFEDPEMVKFVAAKLRDPKEVSRARIFPYQLLVAYRFATDVPMEIKLALQDALDLATANVPAFEGPVAVFPDVSSSMDSPVSGSRGSATSKVSCRDVAALIAATILRRNPEAIVLPFKEDIVRININPRDSVITIAEQIAKCGSGGTNCSAPLRALNHQKRKIRMAIFVSDNESWMDTNTKYASGYTSNATATMVEWEALRARNPGAKLVCIDLAPNGSRQAPTREDILNVGGFSDEVFTLMTEFEKGSGKGHWVKKIEALDFEPKMRAPAPASEETVSAP